MGSIACHITPLVINSFGVDTQTHKHTHTDSNTHTDICTEIILRNQGQCVPGLTSHCMPGLTGKLELQGFRFNSQRTCVANSIQFQCQTTKIQAAKVSDFVLLCTNKYICTCMRRIQQFLLFILLEQFLLFTLQKENAILFTNYHDHIL